MSKAAFIQCVLQAAVLGFEVATESSIVSKLKNLECYGKTAMRDAISLGTKLLIEIRNFHNKVGMPNIWNFIHIVITDGEDTSSQINEFELMLQMGVVGQLIPAHLLKTIYIGVDLDHNSNAEEELKNLAEFGGSGAELKSITADEMDQIFQKIVISLRNRISVQQLTIEANDAKLQMTRFQAKPEINLQLNRYLVLFTIDMSGSMEGKRHKKVVNAMNEIISTLGDEDLVCGIVFNNECKILSKLDEVEWNEKYYQAKRQEQLVQQLTQIAMIQQLAALDYQRQQIQKQQEQLRQQEQQEQQRQQEQQKQQQLQKQQEQQKLLEIEQKQQQFSVSQATTIDPVVQKDDCCKCLIF